MQLKIKDSVADKGTKDFNPNVIQAFNQAVSNNQVLMALTYLGEIIEAHEKALEELKAALKATKPVAKKAAQKADDGS